MITRKEAIFKRIEALNPAQFEKLLELCKAEKLIEGEGRSEQVTRDNRTRRERITKTATPTAAKLAKELKQKAPKRKIHNHIKSISYKAV